MMISKKYINHDQLNEEKFVFYQFMNLMAALWLNFFTCMHGDCIIRYVMISDSSVITTVGTGKNMTSAGVLKMAIHLI